MNSPNLVNLMFTDRDRQYMYEHLVKFHSHELNNENIWGNIRNKGFSCKGLITRDIFNLFRDINTAANS